MTAELECTTCGRNDVVTPEGIEPRCYRHDEDAPALPGAYGIEEDPAGPLQCETCQRRWSEDITPAGRCPWEHLHAEDGEE